MSWFRWFQSPPELKHVQCEPDRIWLSRPARQAAFLAELRERAEQDSLVLVMLFFPNTLEEMRGLLAQQGLPHRLWEGRLDPARVFAEIAAADPVRIVLVPAVALVEGEPAADVGDKAHHISIVLADRHPLRRREDAVLSFARSLPLFCRVAGYYSLDDPVMQRFSGDWVAAILKRLGMQENEAIESRMITRRLQAAQDQVSRIATGDQPADSPEEWFQLNCPPDS